MFRQYRKVFKSGGVKSNDENTMKSNDGIPSPSWKWEWRYVFLGDILNKNIRSKK